MLSQGTPTARSTNATNAMKPQNRYYLDYYATYFGFHCRNSVCNFLYLLFSVINSRSVESLIAEYLNKLLQICYLKYNKNTFIKCTVVISVIILLDMPNYTVAILYTLTLSETLRELHMQAIYILFLSNYFLLLDVKPLTIPVL